MFHIYSDFQTKKSISLKKMLNKLGHRINFVESHKLKPTTH